MKKRHLIIFLPYLLSGSIPVFSQKPKKENGFRDAQMITAKEIDQEVLDTLKKSTTVFFYGKETGQSLDSLKAALSTAWDLTPFIFENIDKIWNYIGEKGYSYFVIEGARSGADFKNNSGSTRSFANLHIYLTLRSSIGPGLCRIELYPDPETLRSDDYDHFKYETAYKKGHFYNWSPVYLKAHVQAVESDLKKGIRPGLDEEFVAEDLQQLLQNDTLYISASMLGKYNPWAGKETGKQADLFKVLKSPYRICSDSELYSIFITENRGRLLFEYVKSSTLKYISIHDLKKKEVVYKDFDNGYNLHANDLSKIYK